MTNLFTSLVSSNAECVRCGAPGVGACDCWIACPCGWTKLRGGLCSNKQCPHQTARPEDLHWAVALTDEDLQALAWVCEHTGSGATARRIGQALAPRRTTRQAAQMLARMETDGLLLSRGERYEPSLKGIASLIAVAEGITPAH